MAAALALVTVALPAPPAIEAKQAEAEQVVDQIRDIDSQLSKAVDAYNGANERLAAIEAAITVNERHLAIARRANRVAQSNLEQRVLALYLSSDDANTLEVILGASSLGDLIDRIDAAKRVSDEDARIIEQVRLSRGEIRERQTKLRRMLREQRKVVAERTARKREIERRLAERQELYALIADEIERLEAEERARQERLKREAEQRLLGEQRVAEAAPPAPVPDPNGFGIAPPAVYTGVAGIAMQYLGIPYQWGGASPETGFDCSGFVMYVYAQVGVSLPHHTVAQWALGVPVSRDQLQPGDLVFFDGLGHDGIYIGDGLFIHSPHTGDVVKISSIYDSWYAATYVGARRLV